MKLCKENYECVYSKLKNTVYCDCLKNSSCETNYAKSSLFNETIMVVNNKTELINNSNLSYKYKLKN